MIGVVIHKAFAPMFKNIFCDKDKNPYGLDYDLIWQLNMYITHSTLTLVNKYVLNNQYFVSLALITASF